MLSLLLDTATERGLVALCQGNKVLKEIHLPFGLHNSKALFYELDNLLSSVKISKKMLQCIVCGQGPGSYTGMRVAAAAAQSLSFALQIPLIGVPTTTGFIPDVEGDFAVLIDAKISGVYMQKGIKENQSIRFLTDPEIVSLELLPQKLANVISIVTPNELQLKQKVTGSFIWFEKGLSAEIMIKESYNRKSSLNLLYLRKTQAEIERLNVV